MAKHNTEGLLSLIAGKRGNLVNIKLFRGDRELVCAEELENQIRSAILQVRMGQADIADKFPDSKTDPRNIAELVASLQLNFAKGYSKGTSHQSRALFLYGGNKKNMTARHLIEHFSAQTMLPIKVPDVAAKIVELGIEDQIQFIGVDLDIGAMRGQFIRTTTRRDGVYGEPIYCADIYYARNQDLDWQRFVCCKEMMHLFDQEAWYTKNAEELRHLTGKLSLSPDLQFKANDGLKAYMDKFAVLQALCVLFPIAVRNLLLEPYNGGVISSEIIAQIAEIPQKYIRLAMEDYWDGLADAILALGEQRSCKLRAMFTESATFLVLLINPPAVIGCY